MKTLTASMSAHIASTCTTLATCWQLIQVKNQPHIVSAVRSTAGRIITRGDHGRSVGDMIHIISANGMTELNENYYQVTSVIDVKTFEINQDTTTYSTYASGGQVRFVQGFTNNAIDLTVSGITYEAATGYGITEIEGKSNLAVDNLEIEALLTSDNITDAALMAGTYDHSEIFIFLVDYTNPNAGQIPMKYGTLGEIRVGRTSYWAEQRGLAQHLQQGIGRTYGIECDADFGDVRCNFNVESTRVSGIVVDVTNNARFKTTVTSAAWADGHWDYGVLEILNGSNANVRMEVKHSYATGTFELFEALPFDVLTGDDVNVLRGCDKLYQTCSTYGNTDNFRGFPHLPGIDEILKFGGQ